MKEEEIKKQARELAEKWMPKWKVYCIVCGASNCRNNNGCRICGFDLVKCYGKK